MNYYAAYLKWNSGVRTLKNEEKIDELTKKNQDDFLNHYNEFIKENPKNRDINMVFQAWVIERLSSMQFCIGLIGDEVERLLAMRWRD